MPTGPWSDNDLRQLERQGLSAAEAERQLELFARPPAYADLVRPCTLDDGIVRLDEASAELLRRRHAEAAAAGRFVKFVPASGAATRMFRELFHYQRGPGRGHDWPSIERAASAGDGTAGALLRFVAELSRFAFRGALAAELDRRGAHLDELAARRDYATILDALLDDDGLGYARAPKGLLRFHAAPDGSRTPFEEHLVEAAHHVADGAGRAALHFTVSPEHRASFGEHFAAVRATHEERAGVRYAIAYSEQKRSTDTLAADREDRPFRDERGRLVFRPGGHGALIENLHDLRADLVYVKNIDNVQPDGRKQATLEWKTLLGGFLVELQRRVGEHLRTLRGPAPDAARLDEIDRFVRETLHVTPAAGSAGDDRRAWLIERLDRPLRVCGVVRNTGEPGGGPFWVRDRDGNLGLQIVETAQVDPGDAARQAILRASTHFNPVDLVCALSDPAGRPYDLHRFIDAAAVIVTRKSVGGRPLRALERPGLWNGAMAGWNTVFVEVPLATFSPVKSVLDLLRDEHQPPAD